MATKGAVNAKDTMARAAPKGAPRPVQTRHIQVQDTLPDGAPEVRRPRYQGAPAGDGRKDDHKPGDHPLHARHAERRSHAAVGGARSGSYKDNFFEDNIDDAQMMPWFSEERMRNGWYLGEIVSVAVLLLINL